MTAGGDFSFLSFQVVREQLQSWARLSHHTEAAPKKLRGAADALKTWRKRLGTYRCDAEAQVPLSECCLPPARRLQLCGLSQETFQRLGVSNWHVHCLQQQCWRGQLPSHRSLPPWLDLCLPLSSPLPGGWLHTQLHVRCCLAQAFGPMGNSIITQSLLTIAANLLASKPRKGLLAPSGRWKGSLGYLLELLE